MMPGIDPRQMAMMMKKLGVQMQDIPDVREVVIRTATKEYLIRRASVSIMRAQGTETWQIQGKAEVHEVSAPAPATAPPPPTLHAMPASPAVNVPPTAPIPEEDVQLVMQQTGKDAATARKALELSGGDIAEAIVKLS